jgi:hypothetical protein
LDSATSLYLLCSPQPSADETRLQRLAQFLGLKVRTLNEPTEDETMQEVAVHIAATCQSLEAFQKQPLGRAWLRTRLATKGSSLFITGITASTECLRTIEDLLPGVVRLVTPVTRHGSAYTIAPVPSTGMPQFAGLTFGPVDIEADGVFTLGHRAGSVTELVSIDGRPCYMKAVRGGASCFLLACTQVLDIDSPALADEQPINRFLRFVPFLAYLRLTFGVLCWHNVAPAACFIIDDPLLKERYGFLDFNGLESRMAQSRFSMNIAFIPWNCRRTDRRAAQRFKRPDRRFSISIHGCDHTEGEFGATDERWLRCQSRRALSRMDLHEALTGIRHNRVMVFPQGVFSKASLEALGAEGFLAAVNSTIYPVDSTPGEVRVSDLLEVAVVRFGGAPLFLRRYPHRMEAIALDLFLGRQAIIVEHHGFFKDGYGNAERCTAFVNGIAPGVTWTDLEELCTSACLTREEPGDAVHVRAFGPILRLRNHLDERMRFHVSNVGVLGTPESVIWNGRAMDFEVHSSGVVSDISLNPGEAGVLVFQCARKGAQIDDMVPTTMDRFKVFARRHLSEIRDNYLDRSVILSRVARLGKGLLPRM